MFTAGEIDLIRKESPRAEKTGQLTKKQLELIYEKGLFHLLVPTKLGGKAMPLPEFAHLMEDLAVVDGSFAWTVNLGAGANMFAGYMDPETAGPIFSSKKTCVAGSGAVGGTAVKEKNGYRIKGAWKYASGAAHATHFSLNANILEKNQVQSFIVPAEQVKIANSWKVMGMKASSSQDFEVDDIWVPDAYCFDLQQPSPWATAALYKFPFGVLGEINMLVMLTGLTKRFRNLSGQITKEKGIYGKASEHKIYDSPAFQEQFQTTNHAFQQKRKAVFSLLEKLWEKNNEARTIENVEKETFTQLIIESAAASRKMVDSLSPFLGMNLVFESEGIGRVFRDFKVASQHALLSPARG